MTKRKTKSPRSVRTSKRQHSALVAPHLRQFFGRLVRSTSEPSELCEACKVPARSDDYQSHHSDCPDRPCDDYIEDPSAPEALRKYLEFARAPAHGQLLPKPHPVLYADYAGKRVRVTMASRIGDVGITTDLSRELGYDRRVLVSSLSNFSEEP